MARLLALTARLPYPPREGHQLRSWHVLRALAREHEVTLLSFVRDDDVPAECGPLRDLLAGLELFPIPAQRSHAALALALCKSLLGPLPFVAEKYTCAALRRRVAQLAPRVDLIHVDLLPLMRCVGAQARDLPLVLDAHNVEHQLLQQRAAIEPRWMQRLFLRSQVEKLRRFERDACRRASRILACSRDDAAQLAALAPDTPVALVPNGVDVEHCRPGMGAAGGPPQLVFVGQTGWFPNRDGAQWFLAEILPRILAQRPDAQFVLVGKADGLHVPAALRANVRLAGFVEDLAPIVDAAAVYVVPLRSGSGTRLKVLEAMAFGKAIVTTTIGAQGIELEPAHEALFANDAAGFADAVLRLIAEPECAARLGRAARAKAQARYDWTAIGRDIGALYAQLLRDSVRSAPAINRLADEFVDRNFALEQGRALRQEIADPARR